MASVPYNKRTFDRKKKSAYDYEYSKENFDRVGFVLPKGYKDKIKAASASANVSMSEWIRILIDNELNK